MNQIIDHNQIIPALNKCYLDYHEWPETASSAMNSFKYYMEREAGLRLTLKNITDRYGRFGFEVVQAELVDEHQYLVWTLKWT